MLAWGAVAAGIAAPLVRHRLKLRAPVVSALSWPAPAALTIAAPRTRLRDAAVYALQMWAYYAHYDMPDDDPEALLERLRVDYPIEADRFLGAGETPTNRLQRSLGREGRGASARLRAVDSSTGAGSSFPTARSPTSSGATPRSSRAPRR